MNLKQGKYCVKIKLLLRKYSYECFISHLNYWITFLRNCVMVSLYINSWKRSVLYLLEVYMYIYYKQYDSVTGMLLALGLPSCDTVLQNARSCIQNWTVALSVTLSCLNGRCGELQSQQTSRCLSVGRAWDPRLVARAWAEGVLVGKGKRYNCLLVQMQYQAKIAFMIFSCNFDIVNSSVADAGVTDIVW